VNSAFVEPPVRIELLNRSWSDVYADPFDTDLDAVAQACDEA
jgi:hypothetical protein